MRITASYVAIAFGLGSPLLASGSPIPASSVNTSPANSPNPNAGDSSAFSGLAPSGLTANKKSNLDQESVKEVADSPVNYNAGLSRRLQGLGLLGGDGETPAVLDGGLDLTGKEENTAEAKLNLCSILGINCPPVKAGSSTKVDPKKAVNSAKPPKSVTVSTSKGKPKVTTTKPKSTSGGKKSGSGGKHQVNDHHTANGGSSKGGNGGSANGGAADCSTGASLIGLSALNFNSCNGGAGGNASGGASVGGKGGDTLNSLTERDAAQAQDLQHTSTASPILSRAAAIADAKKKKAAPKKSSPKKTLLKSLGIGSNTLPPLIKRDTGVDAYGTQAKTNDLNMDRRQLTDDMEDAENMVPQARADPEGGKGGSSNSGNGGEANGGDSYTAGGSLISVNALNFGSNNGGNGGNAKSGDSQGGHGGETVHNHEPAHKKTQSTEKKLQKAFERDGLTATAQHSPEADSYGLDARGLTATGQHTPETDSYSLNARQEATPPPATGGDDDEEEKHMSFSAYRDQAGDAASVGRRAINYEHQHDATNSKDGYSFSATKDGASAAEAKDETSSPTMESRSIGVNGDRKSTSLDGQDKKSGTEQTLETSYGKRDDDEYMMLMEARESFDEYTSDAEDMDADLLGSSKEAMMMARSNHSSNSGSGNNKNGRITIANAGNGGDARSGNGGDASGHSTDDHSGSKSSKSKSSGSKKSPSKKTSGGNSAKNGGINLNVLNHLFNDNYFEKECGSRGFTKGSGKSHKISASTESHSVGNNNYGGTGTGNGGSANSGNATGGNGGNAVITEQ